MSDKSKYKEWIPRLIPWLVSISIVTLSLYLGFSYMLNKFEKVLDSFIPFSSIMVGFLATLLGILMTIRNTPIMKVIEKEKQLPVLKYYFIEPILCGFIVVIMSTILQLLLASKESWVQYFFATWLFFCCLFVISSFRVIRLLLEILFKSDSTQSGEQINDTPSITGVNNKLNIPTKNKEDKKTNLGQELITEEKN
ncbi:MULTISPECIES: hypothetical protein [Saccharibacillus]|uniref:hypothetical protein n=1 Tax=Saccharibacillus TaxID=456492 RepID=UPI00123A6E77|nr:hypothetical protein [Saccharibacillus sp. WB 17]MWJ30762.1 hypothetical protein [Saccharibacillus sp. WB 17]